MKNLILSLLIFIITMTKIHSDNGEQTTTGCTSKFLLPDRPFMVIWNEPSRTCEAHGIDLNLSAWDIVENKGDTFGGDNMNIYYTLGQWPKLNRKTGKIIQNGGVPQRGDFTAHLKQIASQIKKGQMKPDFDGVAVIDMENWRPLFWENFDSLRQYQVVSIAIAKARYPHLSGDALKKEAQREFEAGSRLFMEGTLNFTRFLRPGGHWGFYGIPRDWGGSDNDRLAYLWRASRGLFPEIYMSPKQSYDYVKHNIKAQVNETLRIWAKFCAPDTLILPYSLCQAGGSFFFSKENLTLSIGMPGQMGSGGVVIWGSSGFFHTHSECLLLQKYVNTTLGPYVKNLTRFLQDCSMSLCSGHGRCVEKQYERLVQKQRKETGQGHCVVREELLEEKGNKGWKDAGSDGDARIHTFDDYVCRCLPGWTGNHCEKKSKRF